MLRSRTEVRVTLPDKIPPAHQIRPRGTVLPPGGSLPLLRDCWPPLEPSFLTDSNICKNTASQRPVSYPTRGRFAGHQIDPTSEINSLFILRAPWFYPICIKVSLGGRPVIQEFSKRSGFAPHRPFQLVHDCLSNGPHVPAVKGARPLPG